MKKQQWFIIWWIIVIFSLIFIGKLFGGISFEQKNTISQFSIDQNISNIEHITGILSIAPWNIDQILWFFDSAKNSIVLQTYEFTEKKFKKLFEDLLKRNVKIKIIMEDKKYQQFKNTFKDIQTSFSWYKNFEIKNDKQMKTTYIHSKFALIDSWFLIQTANLTHSSFFSNREYFFYSQHTWIYQSLSTIFKKDRQWESIKYTDIHPNLLVCPINCRNVLEYLISSANTSIFIQNQYIEDSNLLWLLGEKIQSLWSWNIHIQLPNSDKNKILQQYRWSSIVKLIKKPYIHAKMMLIDNQILYLWSINFSANSMDNNREIGILIKDSWIISEFLTTFYKK